jgi:acetylornithine deacetylase/succinyl-diaminopimelate desuccinylase-like protein
MDTSRLDQYITKHLRESMLDLYRLAKIPSFAAHPESLVECAQMISDLLKKRGFDVSIFQTGAAPIIFAERKGKSDKTLLFYNHYDVQPPDPLELWTTAPFEPTLLDGKLYGRGVDDDKGHFTYRLLTLDALLAEEGELPCTIKFLLEGEEESSSEHLAIFVKEHADLLKADACIWEHGGVDEQENPVVTLGLRGILYVEFSVTTANQDIHSGLGGSILPNAAWRLTWALASLKGTDENVRIAGFYNKVKALPFRTRALLEQLPDLAPDLKERYEVGTFLRGLTGGAELRRYQAHEPSCTICGITSGYQGPGSKTVLPARASAKVDFRLVPDQVPEEIFELLRAHLDRNGFEDVQITDLGNGKPAVTNPDDAFVNLVIDSSREIFGQPMKVIPSSGGSGPSAIVKDVLNLPIVNIGASYPGAQMHAPNENIRVDLYMKAARQLVRILKQFAGE